MFCVNSFSLRAGQAKKKKNIKRIYIYRADGLLNVFSFTELFWLVHFTLTMSVDILNINIQSNFRFNNRFS